MTPFRNPFLARAYRDIVAAFCANKGPVWSTTFGDCAARAGNSASMMFWRGWDQAASSYSARKTLFSAADKRTTGWAWYRAGRDLRVWIERLAACDTPPHSNSPRG